MFIWKNIVRRYRTKRLPKALAIQHGTSFLLHDSLQCANSALSQVSLSESEFHYFRTDVLTQHSRKFHYRKASFIISGQPRKRKSRSKSHRQGPRCLSIRAGGFESTLTLPCRELNLWTSVLLPRTHLLTEEFRLLALRYYYYYYRYSD